MRALAFALLVLTLATGCSRVSQPEGSAHAGNAWTHHGLLRIVDLSEPDSLNPLVGNQQIDAELAYLWGGYLFNYNDRDEFVPELATAMPTLRNGGISRDGRTIVYRLRRGVQWQDGKTFGADDVIFTWHAILNKKNNIPSTVGYDVISRIDKRDDHTIVVHLKAAYAPFTSTFFTASGDPYPILPAHLLASYPNINRIAYNSAPIGTGPFTVERWPAWLEDRLSCEPPLLARPAKTSRDLVFARFRRKYDRHALALARSRSRISRLGQQLRAVPAHRRIPDRADAVHRLRPARAQRQLSAATRRARSPGDVVRARHAGAHYRRHAWRRHRSDVGSAGVLVGVRVGRRALPARPGRARALLDAAGWKVGADGIRVRDGKRLAVVLASSTGSATGNAVNVLAQRAWRDVGIDAQVKLYPTSLFFATAGAGGIVQNSKFDVAFFDWINGTDPDDSTNWMCDQFPPNGQNVNRYCNPALDVAERQALASNDRAVRARAYRAVQRALARDVPSIFLWFARRVSVENTDLKNYRPSKAVTSFSNPAQWEI